MKKILALLLAALMLCPLFIACKDSEENPDITNSSVPDVTVPVVEEDTPDLPSPEEIGDISGDFNILVSGNYARNDFKSDDEGGTAVETAIYRRNMYIKDTYDVDILNEDIIRFGSANGSGDGYAKIYMDYMAGETNYDAAMVGTYDVATLAYSGYIHDLNDIPHLDLSKDYWDQKANADLAINGKMYYTTGDISTVDNVTTHAMIFNKDMLKAYELDDPYQLVREGKWTLETLGTLVRQVGEDANQDGIYNENDIYGLLTWNDPMLAILAGAGEKVCTINADGLIELSFYSERVVSLYDTFTNLVYDNTHVYNYQYDYQLGKGTPSSVWDTNRIKMFDSNQAVFYFNLLTVVEKHRDSETDFGILPYPKFDAEQADYGHMVSAFHCSFLCVPEMSKDFERTGIILEELAYQGKKLLTPAYYDQTLVGQYTRDEESVDMLDIIFSSRVYDVGIYYNIGTYKDQLARMFTQRTPIASMYETYRNTADTKINQINSIFQVVSGD